MSCWLCLVFNQELELTVSIYLLVIQEVFGVDALSLQLKAVHLTQQQKKLTLFFCDLSSS